MSDTTLWLLAGAVALAVILAVGTICVSELRKRKTLLKKMVLSPDDPTFAVATLEFHVGPITRFFFKYPVTVHVIGTGTTWFRYPSLTQCPELLGRELSAHWEKLQLADVAPPQGIDIREPLPERQIHVH